jgi:hypothetical protein
MNGDKSRLRRKYATLTACLRQKNIRRGCASAKRASFEAGVYMHALAALGSPSVPHF